MAKWSKNEPTCYIKQTFKRVIYYRLYDENRDVNNSLSLKDHFNKPHVLQKQGHLDGLVRGLATQHSRKADIDYAREVRYIPQNHTEVVAKFLKMHTGNWRSILWWQLRLRHFEFGHSKGQRPWSTRIHCLPFLVRFKRCARLWRPSRCHVSPGEFQILFIFSNPLIALCTSKTENSCFYFGSLILYCKYVHLVRLPPFSNLFVLNSVSSLICVGLQTIHVYQTLSRLTIVYVHF